MIHQWLCRIGIHYWQLGSKWSSDSSAPFRYCKVCGVMHDTR